jgi:hypothetical protein
MSITVLDAPLVAMALAQCGQMDFAAFAQEHLFNALQIKNVSWQQPTPNHLLSPSRMPPRFATLRCQSCIELFLPCSLNFTLTNPVLYF